MNLKNVYNYSVSFLIIGLQFSCSSNQNQLLQKKWKTVSLQNSTMTREIREMQALIDTIGDNDPELRASINIDSTKFLLQQELEMALQEQKLAEENTLMEFKPNGVVYTTSIDGIDSAMYSVEEGSMIKIDEAKLKGFGESMTFEMLTLTKDSLRIRLIDYGDTSIVTMIPASK
jgi:hypothetical protein